MRHILLLLTLFTFYAVAFSQTKTLPSTQGKPIVIGKVDVIKSSILAEDREINIYLPQEYDTNDTAHFPVVYLLDGGLDEDFLHVCGLYQFNAFPWINNVPPSIIVGIVNKDRQRDMTFPSKDTAELRRYPNTGHSENFIGFIQKELQPFIKANFRVGSSSTLIGESLGGLFATEVLLTSPRLFTNYIIVSPSLWWDNGSMLDRSFQKLQDTSLANTNIYIGVGKEGVTSNKIPRVMEVDANVLADKLQSIKNKKLTVYFDYLPQENHATIMHQALTNALKIRKTECK